MINFNYEEFDMFILDSNNWLNHKPIFYGYKTIDDNGIWLSLDRIGNTLEINTSYVPPCYYLYEDASYFAISNSYYVLYNFLVDKGINLTKQLHYTDEQLKINNNFKPELYNNNTPVKEINIVPIDDKLFIDENGLHHKLQHKEFNTVPVTKSENIIDDWWNKYKLYFDNLFNSGNRINCELSGGFDSRLLYGLWRDYIPSKINMKWHKESDRNKNPYLDGIIGRAILNDRQKERLNLPNLDRVYRDINFNSLLLFSEGNFALTKEMQAQLSEKIVVGNLVYEISGSGSNYLRRNNLREVSFIEGTLRRYFMQRALYNYYAKRCLVIHPFYEYSDLYKIYDYDFDLLLIAYLKYCPDLLEIPFAHGEIYHVFDKNNAPVTNEAIELINSWKENNNE